MLPLLFRWVTRGLLTLCLVLGLGVFLKVTAQPVQAANTCGFRCSVTMRPDAMNCNPHADPSGNPTVESLPCTTQCNSMCRRLGMARDTGATPSCIDSTERSGASRCGACTCIPQVTLLCSGRVSGGADPECTTQCNNTCSASRVTGLQSGESISCVTGGSSPPSCVPASRQRSETYCRACITECQRGGGGTSMSETACLGVCATDRLFNVCQGFSAQDLGIAPAAASGGSVGSRTSGSSGGSRTSGSSGSNGSSGSSGATGSSGTSGSSGATGGTPSGICHFSCQPQTTPTACTADSDCATPCQQVCGRSFRDGQCVTSGPGAARCAPAATPGAARQCVFECSIGTSTQERSCNPQGTDDQAPGRVCGGFCETACRDASTQRFTGTPRLCASTAPTCASAGGSGAPGSTGSGQSGSSGGTTDSSNSDSSGSSGSSGGGESGASQTLGASGGGSRLSNPLTGVDSIAGLVGRLIKGVLGIVGSLALLMFVYGGVRWILSAGDTKDITAAQNIIRNATIGMLLIFFSYSISSIVLGFLSDVGGGSANSSSSSRQNQALAGCVEYAVTHGHIGRNEALDRTNPNWSCRETQPSERSNTSRCIRNACPTSQGHSLTTLCCAPLANTSPTEPGDVGAPAPTTPAPTGGAGGGGGVGVGGGAGGGGVSRDTAGPQGTCTCSPSVGGGLISTFASSDQIAQARNACQGPPANGRFDESSFTCTGRSTARECTTVETELNRLLSGAPVSARCTWAQ